MNAMVTDYYPVASNVRIVLTWKQQNSKGFFKMIIV